jgi:membrane dipeptidase
LNDSLITAIAEKGGVIQLALFSEYIMDEKPNAKRDSARTAFNEKWADRDRLDQDAQRAYRQARRTLDEAYPRFLPTVADAIDHIDHIVNLVGVEHVGIGSDLDGGGELADCYDVTGFPKITAELLKRGYTTEAIQKIWSGNLLRVFREVEAQAGTISERP